MEYIEEHGNILDKVPDKISFAPRAMLKKWHQIIIQKILTWFDSSIVKESQLICAMPWIFYDGWFKQ